jgi:integrase
MKGTAMPQTSKRGASYTKRLSLTNPATGERIQPRVTASTKRELLQKEALIRAEFAAGGRLQSNDHTVAEYLTSWLGSTKVKPATQAQWTRIVEQHIIPNGLGAIRLGALKHSHIQQFIDGRVAAGLSPNYVRVMHAILSIALRRAVRLEVLQTNPATGCDLPKKTRDTLLCWTEEQIKYFLRATNDDEQQALWLLALTVGLRRGELVALKWRDIQMDRGTLTISRTMTTRVDGSCFIADEPKSAASRRTIVLPAVCAAALKRRKALQNERRLQLGALWSDDDAVFDNGVGAHYAYPHCLGRKFQSITHHLGLPPIKFHGMRHSAATAMLRNGVPVHTVSHILGHSNPSITLNIYAHVLSDAQTDAAAKIDQMFGT